MLVCILATASAAWSHALTGDAAATVTRVDIDVDRISGSFEVQLGDLAALSVRRQIDTNADGILQPDEERQYLTRKAAAWSKGIVLTVDGVTLPVELQPADVIPRGGRTAMAIPMALLFEWHTPLDFADRARQLILTDESEIPGAAHRTAVISAGDLIDLSGLETGGQLKGLQVEAFDGRIDVTAGFAPAGQGWAVDSPAAPGTQGSSSTPDFLLSQDTPAIWLWFLALGLGALHALMPGHGKTLAAAYLVGERGTGRHALLLGLIVAATHVLSVTVVGVGGLLLARVWLPTPQLAPWATVGAGGLVLGLGCWLLIRHLTADGDLPDHAHDHSFDRDHGDDHDHDARFRPVSEDAPRTRTRHHTHAHVHEHVHRHLHLPSTVTSRGLLLLGFSSGLLPCVSAFALLLTVAAQAGIAQGLSLLLAFSLGLALVLSGVGMLVVHARPVVENWQGGSRWTRRVPVISALLVLAMGGWTLLRGLMAVGILFVRW